MILPGERRNLKVTFNLYGLAIWKDTQLAIVQIVTYYSSQIKFLLSQKHLPQRLLLKRHVKATRRKIEEIMTGPIMLESDYNVNLECYPMNQNSNALISQQDTDETHRNA